MIHSLLFLKEENEYCSNLPLSDGEKYANFSPRQWFLNISFYDNHLLTFLE